VRFSGVVDCFANDADTRQNVVDVKIAAETCKRQQVEGVHTAARPPVAVSRAVETEKLQLTPRRIPQQATSNKHI
jgi:hypothetical protein